MYTRNQSSADDKGAPFAAREKEERDPVKQKQSHNVSFNCDNISNNISNNISKNMIEIVIANKIDNNIIEF